MSKQRGSVFILALMVLTAATTVVALTVAAQRAQFQSTLNRMEQTRARLMAESAIQQALGELSSMTSTDVVDKNGTWSTLGDQGATKFIVGGQSFRIQIVDGASLSNLNSATEAQLQNMGLSQSQIDSLLDWRESGVVARTEGAKSDYYRGLKKPYNAKEARLESITETLLIKDWLPSTLVEVPDTSTTGITPRPIAQIATVDSFAPNRDGTGQQKQNINNAQVPQFIQAGLTQNIAQAIVARRTGLGRFDSMSQVFSTPGLDNRAAGILLDRFSTSAAPRIEGMININTATEDVLMTLPGMTSDIAQGIVSRQSTGFANLSEIFQIAGVTTNLLSQMGGQIAVGSDTFLIRCEGQAGATKICLEAVILVENNTPRILKVYETLKSDMTTLWDWPQETTSETVIAEDTQS